jgi:hypothetical protein
VAKLYPRALGSLFVAFYDLQGCGGGILTRLHTGKPTVQRMNLNYKEPVKLDLLIALLNKSRIN